MSRRLEGNGGGSGWPDAPAWSPGTRLWVITMAVVASALAWWNVRQLTTVVVSAVLLAYILSPAIGLLQRRLRLRRSVAAMAVFGALAFGAAIIPVIAAPGMARGLQSFAAPALWDGLIEELIADVPAEVQLFDRSVALLPLLEQVRPQVQTAEAAVLGRDSLVWMLGFATDFAFTLFGVLLTFFTSLYVAIDSPRLITWLEGKVPGPYHSSYHALRIAVERTWRAYFRGQLLLAAIIFAMTTFGLLVLGVPYAVPLGILAGVLEVIPRLGPVISVIPAVAVALAQPSSTMPDLPQWAFVLLVLGLYILIQQIENNFLVPRVLGGSVNLPPAVVLIGAVAGAMMAGVVGILLAAPIIGTVRVLGSWLYHQLMRPYLAAPEAAEASAAAGADDPPQESRVDPAVPGDDGP